MSSPSDPLDRNSRRVMGGVSTALLVVGWAGIVFGVIGVVAGLLAYRAGGVDALIPLAAAGLLLAGFFLLALAYILRSLLSILRHQRGERGGSSDPTERGEDLEDEDARGEGGNRFTPRAGDSRSPSD